MYRTSRPNSILLATLVASAPALLAGCGLLDGLPSRDARCEMRPEREQCTDWRDFKGPSFATMEGVCATLKTANQGGVFQVDARCDVTGSVGGCGSTSLDGTQQTNWFYPPRFTSEAEVKEECGNGQEYIPPTP